MPPLSVLLAAVGRGSGFSASHLIPGTYGQDDLLPGGGKIRGLNLVASQAQWQHAGNAAGDGWAVLWRWWDLAWLQAQLDDAVDMGVNVVRVMGSVVGIARGYYTEAAYLDLWSIFIDECTDRGLYVYPCFHPGSDSAYQTEIAQSDLEGYAARWAQRVGRTKRCIAIDIIQEDDAYGSSSNGSALKAAIRAVSDLPLTYSITGTTRSQLGHADNNDAVLDLFTTVDFFDFHWYYAPAASDIETYWWDNGPGRPFKKVVVGEFGSPLSVGAGAQTARYQAIVDCLSYEGDSGRRPAGGFAWVARDFGTNAATEKWGLSEADGTRRTYISDVFETLPVT